MNQPTCTLQKSTRLGNSWPWLSKISKMPKRISRTITHWRDGSYLWERNALRGIAWMDARRRDLLEAIKGTSSAKECRLLAWLASMAPSNGVIVEIGAFWGRTTAWLCEGAIQHEVPLPVFSIDPHENGSWQAYQTTVMDMNLIKRGLNVIRKRSQEAGRYWKTPIAMLWIDGCHNYEAVRDDINFFVPHVVPGGWIVFDDAAGGAFPGCEQAIAECMPDFPNIIHRVTLRHLQLFQVLQ